MSAPQLRVIEGGRGSLAMQDWRTILAPALREAEGSTTPEIDAAIAAEMGSVRTARIAAQIARMSRRRPPPARFSAGATIALTAAVMALGFALGAALGG